MILQNNLWAQQNLNEQKNYRKRFQFKYVCNYLFQNNKIICKLKIADKEKGFDSMSNRSSSFETSLWE